MDRSYFCIYPISTILSDLKMVIPEGISTEIFSTSYDFRRICLLNSLLLGVPHLEETVQYFVQTIREREVLPIEALEKLSKAKVFFPGKLGYIELLFRAQIKKKKYTPGEWYCTDFGIPYPPPENYPRVTSKAFRLYGSNIYDFELSYFNLTGFSFSFEDELVSRLEKTRVGSYYAVLIPGEKKDRIQEKSSLGRGVVNEKFRYITLTQKALESVQTIIAKYRDPVTPPGVTPKQKVATIPAPVRKQVWRVYNGNCGSAGCFVCGIEISSLDYECGHIHPRSLGGPNTVDNLLPICGVCNRSMSDRHLFEYTDEQYSKLNSRVFSLDLYKNWKKKK